MAQRLKVVSQLRLRDFAPVPPALKEPTTGLTMGESAEKMAQTNGIPRAEQDAFALASHQRAAAAWDEGRFEGEVMHVPVPPRYERVSARDNLVRKDTTLEALSQLRPVFDRRYGTITAGNASPLTDGAAALLLMSEEKARALGLSPLGYLRSYAYAALDPARPAPAGAGLRGAGGAGSRSAHPGRHGPGRHARGLRRPGALEPAGLRLPGLRREGAGPSQPMGEVDPARLNVNGGSIALGHPFAATGARMILQTLRELARRQKQYALLTVCAAGGLGAAMVLERE